MRSSPSITEQNLGAEPGAVLRLLALFQFCPCWFPQPFHQTVSSAFLPPEQGRIEEEDGVLLVVIIITFVFMDE